jgi:glutamyl-tRNA synthetase
MRHVEMHEYSRLNFVNAVLSKRKLQWFVDQGLVDGWDDPRFPTVRGIMRRGLTIAALRDFVHRQGFSQGSNLMEWDKIWAINGQVIDPIAPRYWCIAAHPDPWHITLTGDGVPATDEFRSIALHKKNESCGTKAMSFTGAIQLEHADAATLVVGEEITLMNWGNAFVTSAANGRAELKLHLEGDFKKTKKKVTRPHFRALFVFVFFTFSKSRPVCYLTPMFPCCRCRCTGCHLPPTSTVCCSS